MGMWWLVGACVVTLGLGVFAWQTRRDAWARDARCVVARGIAGTVIFALGGIVILSVAVVTRWVFGADVY
ncbi:MAG: hypothetical protein QOF54_2097 [Solirubrobacteraceae bacterium]|jgi:hypothetical protein|nr:hypothetical protein [Solirubrobacteraceae bacterium]